MWCDTAHQELVKVTVLQSAVYPCENIPDTGLEINPCVPDSFQVQLCVCGSSL